MIKTCGLVAGDEESWTLFAEVMDKVVSARHGGYAPDAKHPTDMNPENISKRKIDPENKYVITSRCRTGRSVRGFPLPPCNSFQERRDIEDCLVKGLMKLDGELKGDYFPLAGSRSYAPKPNGMSHEEEEALRGAGNLSRSPTPPSFCPPDVVATGPTLVVSSITKLETSSFGSTRRTTPESSLWRRETTSELSSNALPKPPPSSLRCSRAWVRNLCTMTIWVTS